MQRLTVISGLEGEGKTLELMSDYFDHYTNDVTSKSLIPVLISLQKQENVNVDILKDFKEHIKDIGTEGFPEMYKFLDGKHIKSTAFSFADVIDIQAIKDIIEENLKISDCVFYIDNAHLLGVNAVSILLSLMDDYPNNEYLNSFDVICTALRGDSDKK